MAQWKTYNGSAEQIKEMVEAPHGYTVADAKGAQSPILRASIKPGSLRFESDESMVKRLAEIGANRYLICEPQPDKEIMEIWLKTGQPVFIICFGGWSALPPASLSPGAKLTVHAGLWVIETDKPVWNIPGARYSLTHPLGGQQ